MAFLAHHPGRGWWGTEQLSPVSGHPSLQTQVLETHGNQSLQKFSLPCEKAINMILILEIIQMNAARLRGLFQCG